MNKPTLRPTAELSTHPDAARLPQFDTEDVRFQTILAQVRERGGPARPLLADEAGRVLVGLMEFKAVRLLKLAEVPVVTVAESEVATTILSELCLRKHLSKSAIAYLAYPLLKPAMEEAVHRTRKKVEKNLLSGCHSRAGLPDDVGNTLHEIAERFGISREMLDRAKRVHTLFAKDARYRALIEPKLLGEYVGGEHDKSRPPGLGAVLAGYEGWLNGGEQRDNSQLELSFKNLNGTMQLFSRWGGLDEQARKTLLDGTASDPGLRARIQKLTPEEAAAAADFTATVTSELRKRAKEEGK